MLAAAKLLLWHVLKCFKQGVVVWADCTFRVEHLVVRVVEKVIPERRVTILQADTPH